MRATAVPGATELHPHTATGRRFTTTRSVRLGDVDPAGLLRLDATARYLQDVATDDADDCVLYFSHENHAKIFPRSRGVIGIQHHGEKGQTYKFRNLRIKELE